ncbi:class I SAM-dependent methyltransferase [Kineosporia sp. J2-2]|uniref:Class I SAM-dependent methyltransferase n=1 Tax=Kineosporia corallincola TaxID=2835133 RepID=A0ABS5TTR5_9ACTN|nr:class I SAM-dependent methyltransferase [Kineosporia corallincola]MBT0774199.1 class I SAM-dependent methyltransferase [Kineosporia corallincola]
MRIRPRARFTAQAMQAANLLYRRPVLADEIAGPASAHAAAVSSLLHRDRGVVLDLGCGTGRMLGEVAGLRPRWDLYGVDWQLHLIRYAAQVRPGPTYERRDIRHVDIGRYADVITCIDVLNDIPPRAVKDVLRTIARHSRPGTLLLTQLTPPTRPLVTRTLATPTPLNLLPRRQARDEPEHTQQIHSVLGELTVTTRTTVSGVRNSCETIHRSWFFEDGSSVQDTFRRWPLQPDDLAGRLARLGFAPHHGLQHGHGSAGDLRVHVFTGKSPAAATTRIPRARRQHQVHLSYRFSALSRSMPAVIPHHDVLQIGAITS